MDKPLGAILDAIQAEAENLIFGIMKKYGLPPSLMDRILDGVQLNLKQMKAEEYAEILNSIEKYDGTLEDLKNTGLVEVEENETISGAKK